MNVVSEAAAGLPAVRVSGEVDMSNTQRIADVVDSTVGNDAHALVLDLTGVTYLDSSGVRLLYQLDARLTAHQQRLVLVVPAGATILRTLRAAGVIGSLVLASSTDAAMLIARSAIDSGHRANG